MKDGDEGRRRWQAVAEAVDAERKVVLCWRGGGIYRPGEKAP